MEHVAPMQKAMKIAVATILWACSFPLFTSRVTSPVVAVPRNEKRNRAPSHVRDAGMRAAN
eukprot:scaffold1248_cov393-Prasinococcus_capsulatus_cf.AAC.26